MDTLISRLNSIPNAYFEFIDSVADYAEIKPEHLTLLMGFLDENPAATVTDVLKFISDQPDFFDNEAEEDADVLAG